MRVVFSEAAAREFGSLPSTVKQRVVNVIKRLAHWPEVSGAKPMRGTLAGEYRIRTGDWRVRFTVKGDVVIVKIAHRASVYDD
jgi:mRNA-degrading endonuclease RelE of RelBE toxin-antitoxin system